MKILVLFYSAYGHTYKMAEAAAEGAGQVEGAEVDIKQVPETLPEELRDKIGITEARKKFAHIPVAKWRSCLIMMLSYSAPLPDME